jgi:hypothetical protein
VVARSSVPVIGTHGSPYLEKHHWQLDLGFRYQRSDRHFIGIKEQPQRYVLGNQVINWIYLGDISPTFAITDRTTVSFSLPLLFADRSQAIRGPNGAVASRYTTHSRGISDSALMFRRWMFNTEEHTTQNISLGAGIKIPTGNDHVYDVFHTSLTSTSTHTIDQSIMPGDGGVGAIVDMQAFKRIWRMTLNAAGTYLINPMNTNGIQTARSPAEAIFSVPDQYLARVYAAMPVLPDKYGLAVQIGGRFEGVPVHDLIGKSDGFRRPGYAISIEPGVIWGFKQYVFNMSVPVALKRNRLRSVPDFATGGAGDAAFADYFWIFGLSRRF